MLRYHYSASARAASTFWNRRRKGFELRDFQLSLSLVSFIRAGIWDKFGIDEEAKLLDN